MARSRTGTSVARVSASALANSMTSCPNPTRAFSDAPRCLRCRLIQRRDLCDLHRKHTLLLAPKSAATSPLESDMKEPRRVGGVPVKISSCRRPGQAFRWAAGSAVRGYGWAAHLAVPTSGQAAADLAAPVCCFVRTVAAGPCCPGSSKSPKIAEL
jgi:hypothetical protein